MTTVLRFQALFQTDGEPDTCPPRWQPNQVRRLPTKLPPWYRTCTMIIFLFLPHNTDDSSFLQPFLEAERSDVIATVPGRRESSSLPPSLSAPSSCPSGLPTVFIFPLNILLYLSCYPSALPRHLRTITPDTHHDQSMNLSDSTHSVIRRTYV